MQVSFTSRKPASYDGLLVFSFDALLVFCSLAMMKLDCYDETLHIVICMDRWNYVQPTMYVWMDIYVLDIYYVGYICAGSCDIFAVIYFL